MAFAERPRHALPASRCWGGTGDDRTGQGAVAAHGRLRASHADREQVIDTLKTAFADGRLDEDELDARVGQALAACTYAELATATVGIPAAPAQAPPPRRPTRPPVNKETVTRGLAAAGAMIPPALFVAAAYGPLASPPRPPGPPAAVPRVARRDHLRDHHACQAA